MYYVYIIQSTLDQGRYYTGYSTNVEKRLRDHNHGKDSYTKKYRPWKMKSYIAFPERERAIAFEKYLKTGSGRALAIKHL